MARKGGSRIQQREAEQIAKKLNAKTEERGDHQIATVFAEGKLIGSFGIRRSKKAGHGYIPKQIYVSERQALNLANCTMTVEQYLAALRAAGHLPPPAPQPQAR